MTRRYLIHRIPLYFPEAKQLDPYLERVASSLSATACSVGYRCRAHRVLCRLPKLEQFLVKGGKMTHIWGGGQWCLTSANRGTSGTWAHAGQTHEHIGLRDSPSGRLGFGASVRISLIIPKRGAEPGLRVDLGEACRRRAAVVRTWISLRKMRLG